MVSSMKNKHKRMRSPNLLLSEGIVVTIDIAEHRVQDTTKVKRRRCTLLSCQNDDLLDSF